MSGGAARGCGAPPRGGAPAAAAAPGPGASCRTCAPGGARSFEEAEETRLLKPRSDICGEIPVKKADGGMDRDR
jgi:hypothetical protein